MKRSNGFLFGVEKVGNLFRAVVYWNVSRRLFVRKNKAALGQMVSKGHLLFQGRLVKDEAKAKAAAEQWVKQHSVFKNVKPGYGWRLQGGVYEAVNA